MEDEGSCVLQNLDKTKEMLHSWCEATGIEFVSKEAAEAYKRRARRVADVIELKVPDRVPVVPITSISSRNKSM